MLAALVDKSLVIAGGAISGAGKGGAQRYTIHELMRQYLYLRLCEQGEAEAAHRRHAQYFEQLAQRVAPHLFESDTIEWRHALEVEQGNLESALHWCTDERNDPQMGLRLAAVLGRFWYLSEQWTSGAAALRRALAVAGAGGDPSAAAGVRTAEALAYARLGELYHALSDHDASAECFDQALARWRTLADPAHLAWTLFQRGSLASSANRGEEAQSFFAESLEQYRRLNNRLRVATVLSHQGSLAITNAQYAYAAETLEECQRLFRELNQQGSLLVALNLLGRARLGLGEVEPAIMYFHAALDIGRERKAQEGMAWALINLGIAHATVEDYGAALGCYRQALNLYVRIQRGGGIMATLEGVAAAYAHNGRSEEAVKLLAAAGRLCRELQQALTAQEVAIQQRAFDDTRAALSAEQWQRAWQSGDRLGVEQAVALALGQSK
jgi:tetratricopeptide (TPR) repeat protein